ncbi:MAG: PKD domain-containing protein, partial [Flavisolibacter sp.]
TTSSGCTETYNLGDAVKVGRKPIVDFTAGPTPVCAFQSVQFNNLTNESDQWYWDFGDGTSSAEENPTHQYTDTGLFSVTFYAINNGCTDSLTKVDYIRIKPPIARFGFETTCTNRRFFQFRDSSIGATSWLWDFGDGTTSTDKDPVHLFPNYTNYNVTLTVSNDTCTHSVTRIVSVITESPDFTASPNPTCRPNTVYLTASGVNTANIVQYEWDLGFGNFVATTSPTIFNYYNNSGIYDITLVTTDKYGCKDTSTKLDYIHIKGPKANFISTNNRGCVGLTTTFNDLTLTDGISNIVNWKWDFGDGVVQNFNSAPFQHTYNTADTFSVKLTVTDAGGCQDSIFYPSIIITSDPIPSFYVDDTLSCPGGVVKFLGTSVVSPVFTSFWDFGDGGTTTFNSPHHTYDAPGLYTVKLRITDQFGCVDSVVKQQLISVSNPVAGFTVNDSISSCTPFEVQFTNASQYYISWLWDLGSGMSTIHDPTQFYNSPGVYPVKLIVTSKGNCKDTAYGNITVVDTTGSKINYLPLNGCKPLGVDFSAYSPGRMSKYTWDFGDGVLITEQDTAITHVYSSFGNFVPKVILTDPAGCIIPVTGLDTIRIKGATVKFGVDSSFFCDRGMVSFIDSTVFNDSISVYHWDFGDGNTSNLQNPVHFFDAPGLYNVTLNVQTQDACVDTFRLNQAIKVVQSPLVRIGGDTVICINDFLEHLGEFQQPDTSLVQWTWQFPNGNNSLLQNPDPQQYGQSGIFTVTTIATNSSGCKDTATRNILVNPLPQVTLPSTMTMQAGFPITIPAEYTNNVIGYTWTPDETLNCNDCPQPIASPKFNTNYTVAFVDSNGCRNTGQVQIVVICKDANVFIPNTFSPNGDGSNDVFYVRGRGLDRVKSLRIFNRWGEVVFEQQQFPVNDPAFGWNGKYKGNKPIPDVYVYQVEVFCDNSQLIRFEGNIALIQ